MSKFKKFLLVFIFVFSVFNFQYVYSAGLVPCGVPDSSGNPNPCTICHLFVGIAGLIEWIRNIVVIAGLFIITLAGVMWIIGIDGMVEMAKKAITGAVIGIIVIFAGWLMIFFGLTLISANLEKNDKNPNQLVRDGWELKCSTKVNINAECGSEGTCEVGSSSNYKIEKTSKGLVITWDCSFGMNIAYCEIIRKEDKVECSKLLVGECVQGKSKKNLESCKEGLICWTCISTDDSNEEECDNSSFKPRCDKNLGVCNLGEASNIDSKNNTWTCTYAKKSIQCPSKTKDLEELYILQADAKKTKNDASAELLELLECIASKLPGGTKATISSISDGNGGVNCYTNHPDWLQCSVVGKTTGCCWHKKNSCHYGGKNCKDKGSVAVDFVGSNLSEIESATKKCDTSAYTLQEYEPRHLHISLGKKLGCGCDN